EGVAVLSRHGDRVLAGGRDRVDHGVVGTGGPHAREVVGAELLNGLLAGGGVVPAAPHRGQVDVGVVLERGHHALVAVGVGLHAPHPADVHDVALPTHLLGQPRHAQAAPLDLVVGHDVRGLAGDGGVHGAHDDVLGHGLLDDPVELLGVRRVDDDRVDPL